MRVYKYKCKMFLFGIVMMLFVASGFFIYSNSPVGAEASKEKCFKSIQIQSGDTLWSIAKDNMGKEYSNVDDYMEEVCEANHISRDDITEGMYIVVPYFAKKA